MLMDGELVALEDERGSDPLYLLGPVKDFGECRLHVKPENVPDSVLPAGSSVAGRMAGITAASVRFLQSTNTCMHSTNGYSVSYP
jgi:hypothetical protein